MKMDLSRRGFLRATAATGATLGMGALTPSALGGMAEAAARRAYTGKFVVIGIPLSTPGRGYTKLLTTFQQQHPGLSISYTSIPSERFVALFSAAAASGEQIDALLLNGQDVRRYALAGSIIPLDNLVSYRDRFQASSLTPYTVKGRLVALPTGPVGGFPIGANTALLERINKPYPATYAELKQVGAALQKQGVAAFTHPGKNIYLWPVWFFTAFAQTTGNKSIQRTFDILGGKGKFTDPDVVEALDLIFQFSRDNLFSRDVLSIDTPGAQTEFLTGRAAFWMGYGSATIAAVTPQVPHMKLAMKLMPRLVSNTSVVPQFPGGPGAAAAIYAKTTPQRRAMALALFNDLTTDANDAYLVRDGQEALGVNKNAPTSSAAVDQQYKALIPRLTTYLDWYWPPEVNGAFQQGIQAGVGGNQSAKQVAQTVQTVFEGLVVKGYKFAR